ncbi:hypothetical protein C8Q76DRAFT_492339 [Earliella scabrosa]|nr:hypothetical protein C8Q76DRAFT_492339 [Earliella scabrosa]
MNEERRRQQGARLCSIRGLRLIIASRERSNEHDRNQQHQNQKLRRLDGATYPHGDRAGARPQNGIVDTPESAEARATASIIAEAPRTPWMIQCTSAIRSWPIMEGVGILMNHNVEKKGGVRLRRSAVIPLNHSRNM